MNELCAEVIVNIDKAHLDKCFYYKVPDDWEKPQIGARVTVPLGKRQVQGWVINYSIPPEDMELRELASVLDRETALPEDLLVLAKWMSRYYLCSLATVLRLMEPPAKPKTVRKKLSQASPTNSSECFLLTEEQEDVLNSLLEGINAQKPREFLLYGVTGSGKTEIYLRAAEAVVAQGKQVLYLVPEIGLTTQAESRFREVFGGQVVVWHCKLAKGERYQIWEGIKNKKISVLIGTRSAIFAPFQSLGLVIIDEEHDSSYKEQEQPCYNAREIARKRIWQHKGTLILGSATPSLESYTRARQNKAGLMVLSKRPEGRTLPQLYLVDLRKERKAGNFSLLSRSLYTKIRNRLQKKEQVILFLNRRGFASMVICPFCGYVMTCPHCSISLVYHKETNDLRCHYCNYKTFVPGSCPRCKSSVKMRLLGAGTQKVEELLAASFPQARLQRLDLDTVRRKGAFAEILKKFAKKEIDILLGTQIVAKGHDFPGVTLVGVLNADSALHLPDFRAAERTYQLLTQVAGRTGRGHIPGEVVIQTYNPDHYSIKSVCRQNYVNFYNEEIQRRSYCGYPPLASLVRLRISGKRKEQVQAVAEEMAATLKNTLVGDISVLGPAPAPISRVKGYFRWQLMLKGNIQGKREEIFKCLYYFRQLSNVIINVDVDPFGF